MAGAGVGRACSPRVWRRHRPSIVVVLKSPGHDVLDAAAVDRIRTRRRFIPARETGSPSRTPCRCRSGFASRWADGGSSRALHAREAVRRARRHQGAVLAGRSGLPRHAV